MKIIARATMVLALSACSPGANSDRAGMRPPPPVVADRRAAAEDGCYLPLSAYCKAEKCPDYSRSVAEIRKLGAEQPCLFAFTARCGAFRVTHFGNGLVTASQYFDAAGKLVGAHSTTDAYMSGSPCPNWRHFGENIECEERDVKDYCRSGRTVRERPMRKRSR
jgi:hypothetical protein